MSQISESGSVVISVSGVAFAETAAERATVTCAVGFDGPDRAAVRGQSTRTLAACVDSITELHDAVLGPIVDWTADDVQVWAERPWNNEGTQLPLVHHSRASLSVTFVDFGRLSLWLEDTATLEGITVGGITWTVTDLTRRELEARAQRDAVAHALDKASVYATSLGLGSVTPTELAEPLVFSGPSGRQEASRMFAMDSGATVDFAPAPVRVDVEVHVRFTAERGTAT